MCSTTAALRIQRMIHSSQPWTQGMIHPGIKMVLHPGQTWDMCSPPMHGPPWPDLDQIWAIIVWSSQAWPSSVWSTQSVGSERARCAMGPRRGCSRIAHHFSFSHCRLEMRKTFCLKNCTRNCWTPCRTKERPASVRGPIAYPSPILPTLCSLRRWFLILRFLHFEGAHIWPSLGTVESRVVILVTLTFSNH